MNWTDTDVVMTTDTTVYQVNTTTGLVAVRTADGATVPAVWPTAAAAAGVAALYRGTVAPSTIAEHAGSVLLCGDRRYKIDAPITGGQN